MKKVICVILTIVIFCCISAYCGEAEERHVVYVNILPKFVGHLNVHGELAVSNKVSLLAGLGYMSGFFGYAPQDAEIRTTHYKVGLGFYPGGRPLRGFYVLPNFILGQITLTHTPTRESGSVTWNTISAELGHRWIWKGGVFFDLSIGVGVVSESVVRYGKREERFPGRTGLTHVGIQFGYAW